MSPTDPSDSTSSSAPTRRKLLGTLAATGAVLSLNATTATASAPKKAAAIIAGNDITGEGDEAA